MLRHIGRACQRVRLAAAVPHRLASSLEDSGRAAAWWNKAIQQAPGFIKTCKIELVSVDEDGVVLQMPVDRDHIQVSLCHHSLPLWTILIAGYGRGTRWSNHYPRGHSCWLRVHAEHQRQGNHHNRTQDQFCGLCERRRSAHCPSLVPACREDHSGA